jgi:hypothetical protein
MTTIASEEHTVPVFEIKMYPEDESLVFLQNFGNHLPDYIIS